MMQVDSERLLMPWLGLCVFCNLGKAKQQATAMCGLRTLSAEDTEGFCAKHPQRRIGFRGSHFTGDGYMTLELVIK